MYLVLFEINGVEQAYAVIEHTHPLLEQTLQTLANDHNCPVIGRWIRGPKTVSELQFEPHTYETV